MKWIDMIDDRVWKFMDAFILLSFALWTELARCIHHEYIFHLKTLKHCKLFKIKMLQNTQF